MLTVFKHRADNNVDLQLCIYWCVTTRHLPSIWDIWVILVGGPGFSVVPLILTISLQCLKGWMYVCRWPLSTYCCPRWWEIFAGSCDWHWAVRTAPAGTGRSGWSLPPNRHFHRRCLTQSSQTLTGSPRSPPLWYKIQYDLHEQERTTDASLILELHSYDAGRGSDNSHGGSADCCCGFWPDANCLASASELKRAAKGLQEMFWLLLPWSVISLGLNTYSIQDPSLEEQYRQRLRAMEQDLHCQCMGSWCMYSIWHSRSGGRANLDE